MNKFPLLISLVVLLTNQVGILHAQDAEEMCAVAQFNSQVLGGDLLKLDGIRLIASFGGQSKCGAQLVFGDELKSFVNRLDSAMSMIDDQEITQCAMKIEEQLQGIDGVTVSYKVSADKTIQDINAAVSIVGPIDKNLSESLGSGAVNRFVNYWRDVAQMNDRDLSEYLKTCPLMAQEKAAQEKQKQAAQAAEESKTATPQKLADTLRKMIINCFNIPPNAKDADLSVRIHFKLNKDGSVNGAPEVAQSVNGDPVFDATSRAAMSAIVQCQKYDLPVKKYDWWKENTLDFNPKQFSGN